MGKYYAHLLEEERRLTPEHVARGMGFYEMEQFVKRRTLLVGKERLDAPRPRLLKFDAWEEASRPGSHNVLPLYVEEILRPRAIVYIDLDDSLLREALTRQGSSKKSYITGRVEALPFGRDAFDIVLDFSTTDHLSHDGDFARTLSEVRRVLKSGGLYLLYHANADYRYAWRCSADHHPRSMRLVRRLLEDEGFDIESRCYLYPLLYDRTTVWYRWSAGGRALVRRLPGSLRSMAYTFCNLKRFNEFFFLLARCRK